MLAGPVDRSAGDLRAGFFLFKTTPEKKFVACGQRPSAPLAMARSRAHIAPGLAHKRAARETEMRQRKPIPMAAGVAPQAAELDPLLRPARIYGHPQAVVDDPTLALPEKRAILASWASDACAVDSAPTLRQPASMSRPMPFEAIMEALQALDRLALAKGAENHRAAIRIEDTPLLKV